MGNRWGDGLPPEDAYERHSRDLALVTASFGRFQAEPVPHCFCDACDETGEVLVAALEHALAVTVGGFEEYGAPRGKHYEVGYEAEGVGSRGSSSRVPDPGVPWRQRWAPWPVRRGGPTGWPSHAPG